MDTGLTVLACPQCGAPAGSAARSCQYCGAEFIVRTPASLASLDEGSVRRYVKYYQDQLQKEGGNPDTACALGLCYLELGLYDNAFKQFERSIELDPIHTKAYLYGSLALLKGRRPRAVSLKEIEKIENYLNAGLQVEPGAPLLQLALGLVKYDFYVSNGLRVKGPDPTTLISSAVTMMQNGELEVIARKMRLEHLLGNMV